LLLTCYSPDIGSELNRFATIPLSSAEIGATVLSFFTDVEDDVEGVAMAGFCAMLDVDNLGETAGGALAVWSFLSCSLVREDDE